MTIDNLFCFHNNEFNEIPCKLDSTEYARSFIPNSASTAGRSFDLLREDSKHDLCPEQLVYLTFFSVTPLSESMHRSIVQGGTFHSVQATNWQLLVSFMINRPLAHSINPVESVQVIYLTTRRFELVQPIFFSRQSELSRINLILFIKNASWAVSTQIFLEKIRVDSAPLEFFSKFWVEPDQLKFFSKNSSWAGSTQSLIQNLG